jgi:hypothetical protein
MNATQFAAENLATSGAQWLDAARAYWVDAAQRQVLFWDTLRERGNLYLHHSIEGKPPLLKFGYEQVLDGKALPRPCNYSLLRVLPRNNDPVPAPGARPIVIVDPRAGHGPGIGGFKPDSQVGVSLKAGHPVYFVTFSPDPVAGQTIVDVAHAEARFLEEVIARHPKAKGRPAVIGNCQAGWAVAALGAMRPELMGPIMLNGAPLSYWAGSRDQNPMRYAGGTFGGAWGASLVGDLGGGIFDGAHLVANFENQNPANTYWSKYYNLYANVDREAQRFLDFERWWGGFFRMTREEMEAIVSNLFVGNRLARGGIEIDGKRLDLRNISSPVVVFASWGDNITPPQQALNWIIDVWGDERAIVEAGRTIVYMLHRDVGHLGIFVGGAVAKKEHDQLINTLDQIDLLPPGLYEMELHRKVGPARHEELTYGDYHVTFEPRTIDDLRALEPDGRDDERVFSTIAKVSEWNTSAYQALVRPWLAPMVSRPVGELAMAMSPQRLQRVMMSDANPLMKALREYADAVRDNRAEAGKDNPWRKAEQEVSRAIVRSLDGYRDFRDYWTAQWVDAAYGPFGLGALFPPDRTDEAEAKERAQRRIDAAMAALEPRLGEGGFPEGLVRMLYLAIAENGMVTRRTIRLAEMAGHIARELIAAGRIKSVKREVDWKQVREEQAKIVALFPERAAQALPLLLKNPRERALAVAMVAKIMMRESTSGDPRTALARRAEEALEVDLSRAAAIPDDDLPPELRVIGLQQEA